MLTAAAVRTVQVLRFPVESLRAAVVMAAIDRSRAPGLQVTSTRTFVAGSDWLVLWGPGAPDRFDIMRAQLRAGGAVIALDLPYWQREQKFRVSINAAHPQAWVMRRILSPARLQADGVVLEQTWNPDGPVVVAGIGRKATVQYGALTVRAWETQMIASAQAEGRRVVYRPKQAGTPSPVPDVPVAAAGPIDQVLRGASRVCTWHSNVAVDAIRLGIPVICRDGAAAAVSVGEWEDDLSPLDPAVQRQFLANLAWFQWSIPELPACWAFLQETLA